MPPENRRRVTLQDIAEVLDISRGTVDRAVHNRGRISEETRRKILDKASEMGYIDDKINRFSTLKNKIQMMALFPENPSFFYEMMKKGLLNAVTEQNDPLIDLHIMDYNTEDPEGFRKKLKTHVQNEDLKGIFLVPSGHFDSSLPLPRSSRIPYLTINTDLPESRRRCFIGQDLYQSGRLGAELINKFSPDGILRVISGYQGLWAHDERVRGVQDYLGETDPGHRRTIIYCDDDPVIAEELVREAMNSGPDTQTFLTLTAAATVGAARGIRSLKLKDRIPLVGFDFNPELSAALDDGICDALIGQNPEEQSSLAFKIMYRIVTSGYKPQKDHYVTSTELFLKELKPVISPFPDFPV